MCSLNPQTHPMTRSHQPTLQAGKLRCRTHSSGTRRGSCSDDVVGMGLEPRPWSTGNHTFERACSALRPPRRGARSTTWHLLKKHFNLFFFHYKYIQKIWKIKREGKNHPHPYHTTAVAVGGLASPLSLFLGHMLSFPQLSQCVPLCPAFPRTM